MMNERQKQDVLNRLNRIKGQVGGIQNMIEDDRYCVDVLTQTAAALSALRRVEDRILSAHMNTCVADAMRSGDAQEQQEKVDELIDLIGKIRNHG